jgi:dipeptidyl aminopeptidase/acylaminoacyl peptidase
VHGETSPLVLAKDADAPILLIHGTDDGIVHFVHSALMAQALKEAGKPFEFVKLKNEDHGLAHEETRTQMLESAVAFVEKHNPPN